MKINHNLVIGWAILSAMLLSPVLSFAQNPQINSAARFSEASSAEISLGRLLFYDPILSGNRNVSCATCHHSSLGTADGVSLSLGDGARGLGAERVVDPDNIPESRVPRNAPALFNLGAAEFTSLFHDGRLEQDGSKPSGIRTPLGDEMVVGFDSVLAAQAMFPVLSPDEMAGHYSENDVSKMVRLGRLTHDGGAWEIISARVEALPEYRAGFDEIIGSREIAFADIANVMADFIAFEWRADDSPYDQHLRGAGTLSQAALNGMNLFNGPAGCSVCHSGLFQTDHGFHAIAMPQLGPGKAARFETHSRDTGRMRVTGATEDAYRFRTPSLRNVALTAPYGHAGAYRTLEGVVRHHLDPVAALMSYDRTQVILPDLAGASDWVIMDTPSEISAIAAANELVAVSLTDTEVTEIIAFLNALTDLDGAKGRLGAPLAVPSGLPLD